MKLFTRRIGACIECPNITEDMLFCSESYDAGLRGMPVLRRIPNPGQIAEFCPLPDELVEDGVKDIG